MHMRIMPLSVTMMKDLNQASRIREKELEQQIKGFPTIDESSQIETRKAPENSKMQEEMELFKMQMAYIDSLQNPRPRKMCIRDRETSTAKLFVL